MTVSFQNRPTQTQTARALGCRCRIMKLSTDWHDFRAKLNKLHPPIGKPTQLSMEFADEKETYTGKGL